MTTITAAIAIAIDAVDPQPVVEFWCAALGMRVLRQDQGVTRLGASDVAWPRIDVFTVNEIKPVKEQPFFTVHSEGSSAEEEISRLLVLGAQLAEVGENPTVAWVVLTDPAGNRFRLL